MISLFSCFDHVHGGSAPHLLGVMALPFFSFLGFFFVNVLVAFAAFCFALGGVTTAA
jgi:hypothetical protein